MFLHVRIVHSEMNLNLLTLSLINVAPSSGVWLQSIAAG